MTATIAFVNQKGGVGKTSVTLGMASAAWAAGHRVLVVDVDPQGSATWVLGVDPSETESSSADAILSGRAGAAGKMIVPTTWGDTVHVLPANRKLQVLEAGDGRDPAHRLGKSLQGVADGYDIVLIDCSPSLGNLTRNALAAATHAIMVVEPAALSLRGLAAVADAIDDVWSADNPELDLAGVIVNKVPAVSSEAERRYEELTKTVGKRAVWQPVIPSRVIVNQALAERSPIHAYGARAYDVVEALDELYAKLRRATKR